MIFHGFISQIYLIVTSHLRHGISISLPSIGDHWKHLLSFLNKLGAQPPLDLSQNFLAASQLRTEAAKSPFSPLSEA